METKHIYLEVTPKNIVYLDSIIEAYEGIAVIRTIDAERGHVELTIPSYFYEDVTQILKNLSQHWFPINIQNDS
jgi:hypothetical protein